MSPIIWIILAVVVLILVYLILTYKKLVQVKSKVDVAWNKTDEQFQKRFNLIPDFVETAKKYMPQEEESFTKISELTTSWSNTQTMIEKAKVDNDLSTSLKTIMAVSESYPELKSNEKFSQLTEELRNSESTIYFSTQTYNDSVTMYNKKIGVFPTKLVASIFGFKNRELFNK